MTIRFCLMTIRQAEKNRVLQTFCIRLKLNTIYCNIERKQFLIIINGQPLHRVSATGYVAASLR